jgi:hypothetical protein
MVFTSVVATTLGGIGSGRCESGIGIEGGLFFDAGTRSDEVRIGPTVDTSRDDVGNVDLGFIGLYYMHQLGEDPEANGGFRIGGDVRYLGRYASEYDDEEVEVVGTLLEVGARGDWSTLITDKLSFVVGLRVALALAFPEGELADEIDRQAAEGVSAGGGPRVGVTILPSVGARYAIHSRVNATLNVGLGWSHLSIFDLDETVSGVGYVRDESISNTRFELGLGLEVSL